MRRMREKKRKNNNAEGTWNEQRDCWSVRPTVRLLSVDGTTDGGDYATRYARERNRDV